MNTLYLARYLLAPSLALLLTFTAVVAVVGDTKTEVEDAIKAAIDLYRDDPAAGKASLYDLATNPDIPESCAMWADVNLAALVLIDGSQAYAESWALRTLFEWTLEAIPIMRNDCVIAL